MIVNIGLLNTWQQDTIRINKTYVSLNMLFMFFSPTLILLFGCKYKYVAMDPCTRLYKHVTLPIAWTPFSRVIWVSLVWSTCSVVKVWDHWCMCCNCWCESVRVSLTLQNMFHSLIWETWSSGHAKINLQCTIDVNNHGFPRNRIYKWWVFRIYLC